MDWIYLSPHLDDIALSCGGLVWEQANSGDRVEIWSICAGDPPGRSLSRYAKSLHQRWGTSRNSIGQRRIEDIQSCDSLGAIPLHLHIPDCIYRRSPWDGHPLYASEEAIFGPIDPSELPLVEEICSLFALRAPKTARVVSPLAIGGHVDHRLVRLAAERLGRSLWYYPDYPYVVRQEVEISSFLPASYELSLFQISDEGMQAWFESVAAHRSQISTFWTDLPSMKAALYDYYSRQGGIPLWQPVNL